MTSAESSGARIAGGAVWMIGLRMCVRGLGFISTIVLARLLVPADFGLVAMATTVWSILETILDLNFGLALITEPKGDRRYYDSAWTLSIVKGVVVSLILASTAGLIADYFHEPRIVDIIYFYALASFLSGFQNIGTVNFIKDLQLHRNFAMGIIAKLLSFTVTVVAAITFRNYWALVYGSLVGRMATVLMSYVLCEFRPRLGINKAGELFSFSSWLMASNIINAIVSQIDAVIMGRWATARVLGIYRISLEISALPASEIMVPARQALLGGFAKWASEPAKLSANYIESQAVMLSVALPLTAGIALVSEPLTLALLGEKWIDAVPIIRILVFSAVIQILCDNACLALNAMRKPHINTYVGGGLGLFYVAGLCYGVKFYGIYGAAIAHASSALLYLVCNTFILRIFLKTSLLQVFRLAWRSLIATVVMSAVLLLLKLAYINSLGLNPFVELFLTSGVGAAIFVMVEGALWFLLGWGKGAEARIAEIAFSFLRHRQLSHRPAT